MTISRKRKQKKKAPTLNASADPADTNENYRVKRVRYGALSGVAICLQNKNGPCPLLAIANALLLRGEISIHPDISYISEEALTAKLTEYVHGVNKRHLNAAVDRGTASDEYVMNNQANLAGVVELLPRLKRGIDVNVRFGPKPDSFEFTKEVSCFDVFRTRLLHGWIPDPNDVDTYQALGERSFNQIMDMLIMADIEQEKVSSDAGSRDSGLELVSVKYSNEAGESAEPGEYPSPSSNASNLQEGYGIATESTQESGRAIDGLGQDSGIPPMVESPVTASLSENQVEGEVDSTVAPVAPEDGILYPSASIGGYVVPDAPPVDTATGQPQNSQNSEETHGKRKSSSTDSETVDNGHAANDSTVDERQEEAETTPGDGEGADNLGEEKGASDPSETVPHEENISSDEKSTQTTELIQNLTIDENLQIQNIDEEAEKVENVAAPSKATVHEDPASASSAKEEFELASSGSDQVLKTDGEMKSKSTGKIPNDEIDSISVADLSSHSSTADDIVEVKRDLSEAEGSVERNDTERKPDTLTDRSVQVAHIQEFLKAFPSQLTYYGLAQLHDFVNEGEMCVLFRNNHFSTITRHKDALYVLASDYGFLDEPEIVWEKLNDLSGNTVYTNGNFKPFNARKGEVENVSNTSPPDTYSGPPTSTVSEGSQARDHTPSEPMVTMPSAPPLDGSEFESDEAYAAYLGRLEEENADVAYARRLQQQEERNRASNSNIARDEELARNLHAAEQQAAAQRAQDRQAALRHQQRLGANNDRRSRGSSRGRRTQAAVSSARNPRTASSSENCCIQ